MTKSLRALLRILKPLSTRNARDIAVTGVTDNSAAVKKGMVFVAIQGLRSDGHAFVRDAYARGAVCCVVSKPIALPTPGACMVRVKNTPKALSLLARGFYGFPDTALDKIAITGTKGKTTTAYTIKAILDCAARPAAIISTIEVQFAGTRIPAAHTTPSAIDLQHFFKEMGTRGVRSVVMEVSSHAITQERVHGVDFQWRIFTNLSREHLDYHRTMQDYFSAKAALFKNATARTTAIINIDDAYGKKLAQRLPCKIRTFSLRDPRADVRLGVRTMSTRGSTFTVYSRRGTMSLDTPLFGTHNIYNLAAAITWALYAGIPPVAIKEALALFKGPPGRLEHIYSHRGCEVFVDYAHTHESLRCALQSLRQVYRGKPLIAVFGCGGSRDKTKRPRMGLVASRLADYVFITNDNPRNEDPRLIARQIMRGFRKKFSQYRCVLDRKKAIHEALRKGRATKAVVLIAGKGHEKEQIFKDKTIAFCDKQTALAFLSQKFCRRVGARKIIA